MGELERVRQARWAVAAVIDAPDAVAADRRRVRGGGRCTGVVAPSEPPVPPEARATAGVDPAVTATAVASATTLWRVRMVVTGRSCGVRMDSWVRAASSDRVSCRPGAGSSRKKPSKATTENSASGTSMTSRGRAKAARHSRWLVRRRWWVSSRRSRAGRRACA